MKQNFNFLKSKENISLNQSLIKLSLIEFVHINSQLNDFRLSFLESIVNRAIFD